MARLKRKLQNALFVPAEYYLQSAPPYRKSLDRIRASCHNLPQPQENEYELQGAQILKFKIHHVD